MGPPASEHAEEYISWLLKTGLMPDGFPRSVVYNWYATKSPRLINAYWSLKRHKPYGIDMSRVLADIAAIILSDRGWFLNELTNVWEPNDPNNPEDWKGNSDKEPDYLLH